MILKVRAFLFQGRTNELLRMLKAYQNAKCSKFMKESERKFRFRSKKFADIATFGG